MIVVSNTSPIISIAAIGQLNLLQVTIKLSFPQRFMMKLPMPGKPMSVQ